MPLMHSLVRTLGGHPGAAPAVAAIGELLITRAVTASDGSRSDFNGDGFDDLAIAIPNMEVGDRTNAGAVQIIYGGSNGPTLAGNRLFTQDSAGMPDVSDDFDRFGSSLAWGDFNGDGFSDLAIGAPLEDVGGALHAGAVTVIYGSTLGLDAEGVIDARQFAQGLQGLLGVAQSNDQFGWSLAAGDFDGDGRDDLAIGVVAQDLATNFILAPDAGVVHVLYGDDGGLSAFADEVWSMNSFGVPDVARFGDHFGHSLASGDFNGDGRDDLAIGVPGKPLTPAGGFGFVNQAGATAVIYGSNSGLRGAGAQLWTQNSTGIVDTSESGDNFGFALAAGDFDGDGRDDLAIAAPFEDASVFHDVGVVHALRGTNVGLRATDNIMLIGSGDISSGVGDTLGFALASGDFDGDGHDDLAAGIPRAATPVRPSSGAALVFYGSGDGLAQGRRQVWSQDSPGILDRGEIQDRFGEALWTGDYDGDGFSDLAIGSPRENVGLVADAGAVNVIRGGQHVGLSPRRDLLFFPGMPGLQAPLEFGGFFGFRVTTRP